MTTLKIYIKRLKAKYFFEKTKVPIMEHYCIEEVDQKTTHGQGNIYTTITHHKDEYLEHLRGKHIIGPSKVNTDLVHPSGKTSTLSNNKYFVPNSHLDTDVLEEKVEFRTKNSIIERIDCENFKEHYMHHLKTSNKEIENLITGTKTIALDSSKYCNDKEEIEVIKKESSINVFFKNLNNFNDD